MNKLIFFLLYFCFLLQDTGLAQPISFASSLASLEQKVDSVFSDWNSQNTPGGAIAIIYKGNVLLKKGYGMADVDRKIPITTSHLFNIASTAKQFTATCIALLEEQGKLSFEDDTRKYFPQFQLTKTVTIRHLISHTSGLREAYVLAALSGKVNLRGQVKKRYQTTENLIRLIARQQDLNFNPGDEFAYTNINYILLGEIVHKVSGLSLAEYAHQFIFEPLGMAHSYVNDTYAHLRLTRAIPYQYSDKNKQRFKKKSIKKDQGVVGDNNLITSVDDLLLWNQNFYKNRLGAGNESLLRTLQTRYVLNSGDTIHYAFGLNVTPYKNTVSIGHGGDDYRYTSFMVRFPDRQVDIICLSNRSRYEDTQNKVFAVANLLLEPAVSPANPVTEQVRIPFDAPYFKEYIGRYMGSSPKSRYSFREVFTRNGKPYLSFQPQPTNHVFELLPISNHHYLFKVEEPNVYVEAWFIKSKEDGHYQFFETFKNNTVRYDRKLTDSLSTNSLRRYAGIYTSQELDSQIRVKVAQNGLTLRRGLIKIKTIPVGEDTFYAPDNRALFYFKRDESGMVNEFLISATDFRNVKFSR